MGYVDTGVPEVEKYRTGITTSSGSVASMHTQNPREEDTELLAIVSHRHKVLRFFRIQAPLPRRRG